MSMILAFFFYFLVRSDDVAEGFEAGRAAELHQELVPPCPPQMPNSRGCLLLPAQMPRTPTCTSRVWARQCTSWTAAWPGAECVQGVRGVRGVCSMHMHMHARGAQGVLGVHRVCSLCSADGRLCGVRMDLRGAEASVLSQKRNDSCVDWADHPG